MCQCAEKSTPHMQDGSMLSWQEFRAQTEPERQKLRCFPCTMQPCLFAFSLVRMRSDPPDVSCRLLQAAVCREARGHLLPGAQAPRDSGLCCAGAYECQTAIGRVPVRPSGARQTAAVGHVSAYCVLVTLTCLTPCCVSCRRAWLRWEQLQHWRCRRRRSCVRRWGCHCSSASASWTPACAACAPSPW